MNTRSRVLSLLEGSRDQSLSGEDLARELQVSRTAIWKAVSELKKQGYRIEAVTNRGYRLLPDSDVLSLEGLAPWLQGENAAQNIHIYKQVDSTSLALRRLAQEGAPSGTVALAESQTAGRGRQGRSFHSPHGKGVLLSILLRPQGISLPGAALVTTAASVAVCRAIRDATGLEPQIKWVNDLFLHGRKVCGILTEAVTDFESGMVEWIIVGIGLNFSHLPTDFPPDLRETAGALFPGSTDGALRSRLAAEVIGRARELPQMLESRDFLAEYRSRSLVLGKMVRVLQPTGSWDAEALDIDGDARLLVRRLSDGAELALSAGEVQVRL